jgi:putative addiction module component (TIGR02574 family)
MMSPRVDSIFEAAMQLSDDERIELADRLFFSISPERQAEVERSWAEEAQRRFEAYKDGRIESVPYDDVRRSIRERLRK